MSSNRDNGVIVSHIELNGSDDSISGSHDLAWKTYGSGPESITPRGSELHDVIMGQDPNELANLNFPRGVNSEPESTGQEMQERKGLPSLLASPMGGNTATSNRSIGMDVDEMVVDEAYVGKEHVDFSNAVV